ncbi:hypothetical protein [Luteimonas saliphila]|uniref:hypothetical protein n=1 Tax=Luteimonas saliphila TaxID=2804919 RepID=UPI00192DE1C4|nr:hypothetical protein [Luteimonas saliphila]
MKNVQVAGAAAGSKVSGMVFLLALALLAGPAFAGGGDDFDPAAILLKFVTYTGYGVALGGGWALAVWSLRAMGLLTKRG